MRPISEIDYPKNADEWWLIANTNKEDLRKLTAKYHPMIGKKHAHHITAQQAEQACEIIRDDIRTQNQDKLLHPLEKFDFLLHQKDPQMVDLLNEVWFGMPESESVRYERGFGILCDLCSECYVLEKNNEKKNEN